ncbi:MAG: FAD:protein FMN transferase, partial [Lachnospiraceae bacterium]|nr:FAD:protein FMN transferase [Lachnospiraceae bacterium]
VDEVMYEHDNYVVFDKEGMMLDLGATGKGYALDVAYEMLTEHNISGAMVSVGGSILIYGTKDSYKKEDNTWKVGIRDPKGSQEDLIGYLEYPCEEGFSRYISTSGSYEKYIEKDGVRYHHIYDSKTGYPASSGLASVTVVCDNGLKSDGLSTACFVLGYEKSKELLRHYNAEAVFIDEDNNVTVTDGLKDIYKDNK